MAKPKSSSPHTNLAQSDGEAELRANQWKSNDPFPQIPPALLNSADALAYVKATSLIHPFAQEKLKGASYDVTIEGEVVYWDEKGEKQNVQLLNDGDCFDLRPNSIAFVTLQPTFRMPYYIALRFNLKITHIYKGLLLGTGPLVDPGFSGKLSIPLHNLTNNTYRFCKGDDLITMEFTKMSPNEKWVSSCNAVGHKEKYVGNNIISNRDVNQYIAKALKKDRLNSVISSIPTAMEKSRQDAELASAAAEKIKKNANVQTWASFVAVASLVVSVMTFSFNAVNKANERYDTLSAAYHSMEEDYKTKIGELANQVDSLADMVNSTSYPDEVQHPMDEAEHPTNETVSEIPQ